MHDQSLEQKLRVALQEESDRQPFTITAAELERRLALRRRGGMTPLASLGLAAVVGIGLLGLAGIAGGWFETRPIATTPSPSAVAIASPIPSTAASPSAARLLPSLDAMLDGLDPSTIVRAQAVGPAGGPAATEPALPWSVGFAPETVARDYVVDVACSGSDDLRVAVVEAGVDSVGRGIPFRCDGAGVSGRFIHLAAGDAVAISSSRPASWRIVIRQPALDQPTLQPRDLSPLVPSPGQEVLIDGHSETQVPDYEPTRTGGGILVPTTLDSVAQREGYHVLVTCAGPTPIRYSFSPFVNDQNPPEPLPENHSTTQVECDGAAHEDILDLPLEAGGRIVVTAEARTAWQIIVTADDPPISLAPNEGGWTMSTGLGPTWMTSGNAEGYGGIGPDDGGPVRVVITCSGAATVTGTIQAGTPAPSQGDPFSIDCSNRPGGQTLEREYEHGSIVSEVLYDPHGATIWLAITTQIRTPASPPP